MGKSNVKLNILGLGAGIALTALVLFNVVFGTSVLTNIHNRYIRHLGKQIVRITNLEGTSGATGFLVKGKSGKTIIMTNNHVCGLAQNGKIYIEYKEDRYLVNVIKSYPMNDLCALEAPKTGTKTLDVAKSARTGETVWIIGHPLLDPLSVRSGELSGLTQISVLDRLNPEEGSCVGATYKLIDTTGTMYEFFGIKSICIRELVADSDTLDSLPGNSGSPIVNLFGSVVGVLFAGHESGTRSYSVPLSDLKAFLETL